MDKAAIEAALKALDLVRDSQASSLHFWTLVVAIGVCLEVPALLVEHFHEWKDFRRGIIHSPEKPLVIWFLVGFAGTGLVAIGVAEELRYQRLLDSTEFNARQYNQQLVGLLDVAAGNANKSAGEANKRAAELLKEIQPREISQSSADRIKRALNLYRKPNLGVRVGSYGDTESSRLTHQLISLGGPEITPFVVGFSSQSLFSGAFVCRISSSPPLARIIASEINAEMDSSLNSLNLNVPDGCAPDRLMVFIGVKPPSSTVEPSRKYPAMSQSLSDVAQARMAGSLPNFRGVVTITYLDSVADSPELASQVYASIKKSGVEYVGVTNDRSYREFWKWHASDAKGIEIWHTSDESSRAFAEALWSGVNSRLAGARLISESLKLPSNFPADPPEYRAAHRVEIRIGPR